MKSITIKKSDKPQANMRKLKGIDLPGLDVSKYSGKVKIKDDPILIQKRLRDEWQ